MSKSSSYRNKYRPSKEFNNRRVYEMDELGLTIMIKKRGVIAAARSLPLQRDIDDPAKICAYVHIRKEGNEDPPSVPIFGKDIKVNQNFGDNQPGPSGESRASVEKSRSRSKHRDNRYRSRTKERSLSRGRSRSREKPRRTNRSKSSSRHRSGGRRSRYRSNSPRRRHVSTRRSRSYSSSRHRSANERRKRSVTPLRPGEYRPGHPDLRKRKSRKSRSRSSRSPRTTRKNSRSKSPRNAHRRKSRTRSRSPRYSFRNVKGSPESYSRGRSPHSKSSRQFRSQAEAPFMPMPGMEYGFYDGYAQFHAMQPYRSRVPMVPMYPPHMMMPRMPLMPSAMPFRQRWPVYNSGAAGLKKTIPSTDTTKKQDPKGAIEQVSDQQDISSSRQDNSVDNTTGEV
uniref:Female-specific protein transformer n=1 Tax=Dendroctonus ponderosae TaxID=77166 RepID=A0AAR5PXN4_DENPD